MRSRLDQGRGMPGKNDENVEAVRSVELRRRRSRLPWIYVVYHARLRHRSGAVGEPPLEAAAERKDATDARLQAAVAESTTRFGVSETPERPA